MGKINTKRIKETFNLYLLTAKLLWEGIPLPFRLVMILIGVMTANVLIIDYIFK